MLAKLLRFLYFMNEAARWSIPLCCAVEFSADIAFRGAAPAMRRAEQHGLAPTHIFDWPHVPCSKCVKRQNIPAKKAQWSPAVSQWLDQRGRA